MNVIPCGRPCAYISCLASGRLAECPIKHMPLNLHLNWKPTGQSVSSHMCKLECSLRVAKHGQEATVGPLSLSLRLSLSLSLWLCGGKVFVSAKNKLYQCSAARAGTALYPWALGEPMGLRLMAGSVGEFVIGGKNPEGWAQGGSTKAGLSRRSLITVRGSDNHW